jgi:hypothetical protein
MEKIMKVTTTMHAFLSPNSETTPQALQTEKGVRTMSFFSSKEFWIKQGYVHIGEATITVDVPPERELVDSKVASLREEISKARADSTAKVTQLEGRIQQLLCIENSATPAA